jgi:phage terminase large subunit
MYLYEYDEDSIEKGKEIPVKQNDHCMDALRYLIMGIWKLIKAMIPILKELEKEDDNDR